MQLVQIPCELGKVGRPLESANDAGSGAARDMDLSDMLRCALGDLLGVSQAGTVSRTTEEGMSTLVSSYTNEQLVAFMRMSQSEKNKKPAFFRAVRGEARRRNIIFP